MRRAIAAAMLGVWLCACAAIRPIPECGRQEPVPAPVGASRSSGPSGSSSEWAGTSSLTLGVRQMADDEYWDPVDSQFLIGGDFDFRPRESPLGLELGVSMSFGADDNYQNTGVDLTSLVLDLYLGPRLTLDLADDAVHPYLGAGLALVYADYSGWLYGWGISDSDTAIGGYVHGGVRFDLSESWHIGLDGRWTLGTDVTLFGIDGDADSAAFALLLGTHW